MELSHRVILATICCAPWLAAQTPHQLELVTPGFHLGAVADASTAAATGDVDGDGDLDVVVGNVLRYWSGSNVPPVERLYLNEGGTFRDASTGRLPAVVGETRHVALVDVDGDADLDLFVAKGGQAGRSILLFINDGTGRFTDETSTRGVQGSTRTTMLAIADFDADGDPDVVSGPAVSVSVSLQRNDGNGFFSPVAGAVPDLRIRPSCAAIGDVDGDGDDDLIVGQADEYSQVRYLVQFRNDGNGGFSHDYRWIAPSRDQETSGVALADLDGDGDLDLLAAADGAPNAAYENFGGYFFPFLVDGLPRDNAATQDLAALDVDGDGDVDALFAMAGEPSRLMLNDGAARFSPAPASLWSSATQACRALAVGDYDGDGLQDVFQANSGPNGIWFGISGGGFADTGFGDVPVTATPVGRLAAGDLDGDGDVDAVAAPQEGVLTLLRNDGSGRLTPEAAGIAFTRGHSVILGDVDGDGDLDLVLVGNPVTLYRNPGNGNFAASAMEVMLSASGCRRGVLVDVDGDGDLDGAISNEYRHRLLLNDGSGGFQEVSQAFGSGGASGTHVYAGYVAAGDLDGDGDADIVFDRIDSYVTGVFINDGVGTFVEEGMTRLPTTGQVDGVALADVDGDGDLDLWTGRSDGSKLLINDGSGYFSDGSVTRLPAGTTLRSSLVWVDIDLDGDLDLACAGNGLSTGGVLVNDGAGTFTDDQRFAAPIEGREDLVARDFDGDGDDDLLMGGLHVAAVLYRNLHRQVARIELARCGRPLEVHLFSEPGYASAPGVALLWAGPALAAQPLSLPPYGTFELNPSSSFTLPLQTLSAMARQATFTLAVPANPAFVGAALHYQGALLRGNVRFTNRGTATVY